MVPWSIRRVTGLPPNAKSREIRQNLHRLVQLIRAATEMFLTKPQCHNYANKCSKCALNHPRTSLYDCCRAVKVPCFLPMNGTMT